MDQHIKRKLIGAKNVDVKKAIEVIKNLDILFNLIYN